jgi:hypothetical protein
VSQTLAYLALLEEALGIVDLDQPALADFHEAVGDGASEVAVMADEQARHVINDGDYCVTIGYVDNGFLFQHTKECKYFLRIKKELIILDYTTDFNEKYLLKNADKIELLLDKQIITSKLDMTLDAIGTWPGYVCCYELGKIKKVFYENSDEIPRDKSIYNMLDN